MREITFSVPDETLAALQTTPERLAADVRLAAAIKLYELERLSAGAASKLAGLPQPVFMSKLAEFNIEAFRLTREELGQESRPCPIKGL